MSQNSPGQRGYTIAEMLSVIFVLALLTSAVALIIGPLLRSQSRTQAKVDTVQAAAMALYRLERDLRSSTSGNIFACTTGPSPVCQPAPASLTSTEALVMPTAYSNGTGQFQFVPSSGKPKWQGATVYWVDSAGNLKVAFDAPFGYVTGSLLKITDAQNAVADVTASPNGGMSLARFVGRLAIAGPGAGQGHRLSLQLQAQSTVNGSSNETTYQTDLETRN